MRQEKSFIQIIIIIIKEKKYKKRIKVKRQGRRISDCVREIFYFYFFFSLFISQIYGNRTVDFCRSRRQSWSTRRELHVDTKSLAFRYTSRGRKFSYLCYSNLNAM